MPEPVEIVGAGLLAGLLGWLYTKFGRKAQAAIPPATHQGGGGGLHVTVYPQQTLVDIDTLARTMWGEARGEGPRGMQAVANVVMNRYAQRPRYGNTIEEVCKRPFQFSAWNLTDPNRSQLLTVTTDDPVFRQARDMAEQAVNGQLPDITGGADHYHTRAVSPSWSDGQPVIAHIGNHIFFRLT